MFLAYYFGQYKFRRQEHQVEVVLKSDLYLSKKYIDEQQGGPKGLDEMML